MALTGNNLRGRLSVRSPRKPMKGIHLARLKMMSKFSGNRVDTAR